MAPTRELSPMLKLLAKSRRPGDPRRAPFYGNLSYSGPYVHPQAMGSSNTGMGMGIAGVLGGYGLGPYGLSGYGS